MKKISLVIIMALTGITGIFAQNVDDALRYSQIFYGGTSRFMSMGGAFTALGGDLSSLSQNPAGIGVFRSSEISLSPQLMKINTDARFNEMYTDYIYNFNLSQAGFVSNIISNNQKEGLIKLNFGYSFNKTNNLNQNIMIQGTTNNGSMADYWAETSDGIMFNDLEGPAGIAYDAWVIDTLTGSGGRGYGTVFSNYGDNPPSVYGQNIRRLISYEGYTGEHALSIGGNYSNKIFFGATLGINKLNYSSHFEHLETMDLDIPSRFENFNYTDHYENTGTGYSLKLGAIIRPVETVRVGLAFHSPTWYRINEYFYESISSNFTDGGQFDFENDAMRYNYSLTTPFRALAGVAVQIQKIAILSADYEFVDYSTARFSETGDNYDYSEKNRIIKNTLRSASNLRLGGEVRLNNLYLRAGYGYYGKAFQPGEDNSELDYSSLSFGAGFREKNVYFDLAYTNYKYSQEYLLYDIGNPAIADLSTSKSMFTVTLGFKFGY